MNQQYVCLEFYLMFKKQFVLLKQTFTQINYELNNFTLYL